jgi:hypothetical protein
VIRAETIPFQNTQWVQLKKLVAKGEGLTLEFKRKATYPEKVVREMIAFANTAGGVVLVGVDDNGSIPGLKHPDDESHVIHQALTSCVPPLPVSEEFISIGNSRTVIQYTVKESRRKPHRWRHPSGIKEAFVRIGDQSHTASREVQEICRRRSGTRGVHIRLGDFERVLLKHLETQPANFNEVRRITGASRSITSARLIALALANVITVTPSDKGDVYSLADTAE